MWRRRRRRGRSPVVTILQSLEEAEDDAGEVYPGDADGEDDAADDDGQRVAVGVDEGEDAAREGHDHIEESEENPRQQQEPSLCADAVYKEQRTYDIDDRHQH